MKSLLYIGNQLSKHGINKTSVETLGPLLERSGFTVFYASAQKNKLLRMADMVVKTIACSVRANVVLIDTYSTSNFWYAVAVSQICRLLRKPYIPILHGGDLPKRLRNNPRLSKAVFGNAQINVAPSGYLLRAFEDFGFKNIVQVPNAIGISDYVFRQRQQLQPRLLWVRAFAHIYNPEMAVRVLDVLRRSYPEATLCMIGPAKDNSFAQAQKLAQQLDLPVEFHGKLSKAEWTQKAQDCDVFINTTHFDNMPVSVIEAMALGLPVVSTNVGGLPYLIADNQSGLLVSDNDVAQMVAAIKKLLSNPHFSEAIVTNAHQSVQKFDESVVAAQWAEILQ